MRVTQQDIARIAQVSQATVSRVLAGDDKVEDSLKLRVEDAIQKHNYRLDVRARSLRIKRTGLIGLVVKRPQGGLTDDPFFASLASEIMDYLSGNPYHLCMDMVTSDMSQEAIYDEMLRTRRVDGLILVESQARDERIHRLQREGFPFVLIGNPGSGEALWSVDNDNVHAAEVAGRHLIEQGYKRIGILAGPKGITVSDDRIAGYQRAMRGIQQEHLIWHSDFGIQSARETATLALGGDNPVDALLVLDDFMAMGAVLAARTCGRKIPTDLGLVSFNDTSLCQVLENGLTSVSLNIGQIVHAACDKLLAVIEGETESLDWRTIVDCELHARGSSLRQGKVAA
jgi:DNA-binding LacI/PurR family transcriptional regulator